MKITRVVVAGDITIDWYIARLRPALPVDANEEQDYTLRTSMQRGGALFLSELIKAINGCVTQVDLTKLKSDREPGIAPYWHSFSLCSEVKKLPNERKPMTWRITQFLGLDDPPLSECQRDAEALSSDVRGDAQLIVLTDVDQGFRSIEKIWPASLKQDKSDAWVILRRSRWPKTDKQREADRLWPRLVEAFSGRIILILTAHDLRTSGLEVSLGKSWERTLSDLIRELTGGEWVSRLDACSRLIVSLNTEGAIELYPRLATASLYYDPGELEGDWSARYAGEMRGYTHCLTAGIASQFIQAPPESGVLQPLSHGVAAGLSGGRTLIEEGFAVRLEMEATESKADFADERLVPELSLPIDAVVKRMTSVLESCEPVSVKTDTTAGNTPYRRYDLNNPLVTCAEEERPFTILGDLFPTNNDALDLACRIVESGMADDSWPVPIASFGELKVINRYEAESLRALHTLIENYISSRERSAPLSIAVFGAPGTGKSFTIKSVAHARLERRDLIALTFNLSQFTDANEIIGSFHQIRDAALSGKVPLVFWDEFDTKLKGVDFGWLDYFLSPMQDGEFQQGQVTHKVGRVIFVFAGSVEHAFKTFRQRLCEETTASNRSEKGTDFISRLHGYVDIPSLNVTLGEPSVFLRRALIIRARLKRIPSIVVDGARPNLRIVRIDKRVLHALLSVGEYTYGARSISAIIDMCDLRRRSNLDLSSLPTRAQLEVHLRNASEFLAAARTGVS